MLESRIKRIKELVLSVDAPLDHSVGWVDITDIDNPLLKLYFNGEWTTLAGGGSPTPTPTTLVNPWYRGGTNNRLEIDENLPSRIAGFTSSRSLSASANLNTVYYYIAIASDQSITSIITANQETITSQFVLRTTVVIDDITYKLYEFFLDTLLPLDVTATVRVTGTTN